jgi:hypothetical protein
MGVNVMGGPPFPLDSHKKASDSQIVPMSDTEAALREADVSWRANLGRNFLAMREGRHGGGLAAIGLGFSNAKHEPGQIWRALQGIARLHATLFAPPYLNHHGVEQEAGHCLCSAHLLAKVGSVE